MSADTVHASVEKAMRRSPAIYDFSQWVKICEKAGNFFNVAPLGFDDFYEFSDLSSQRRRKSKPFTNLNDICVVEFQKGSRKMYFATSYDRELEPFDFLTSRVDIVDPPRKTTSRGLKPEKKNGIVTKLLHLMPVEHRSFWKGLPVSKKAKDLLQEDDFETAGFDE